MKRSTLLILAIVSTSVVVFSAFLFMRSYVPQKAPSVEIEVTLARSVTQQIGTSSYTFKLYPYDGGMYLLKVTRGSDFKTTVIVSGHTYTFLDLEVHVAKLISGGVLLEVRTA